MGAVDKNIQTVVARRFPAGRDWGVRWTRSGAQALLKLRLRIRREGESWFEALNSTYAHLTNPRHNHRPPGC